MKSTNNNRTVIIDACRTPIGKFGGSLATQSAVDLGRHCLKNLIERVSEIISPDLAYKGQEALLKRKPYFKTVYPQKTEVEETASFSSSASLVEEAIIGNVLSAGLGQNPARQIIIPGLSRRVPAATLNQVCASGMKSVVMADHLITSGVNQVMIAGGVESMSGSPHLLAARGNGSGERKDPAKFLGKVEMEDTIMRDGLTDAFHNFPMGVTAENLARDWKISREEQDEFAYYSQMKAVEAEKNGRLNSERPNYESEAVNRRTGEPLAFLDHDEFIRHDVDRNKLASLKPVFASSDEGSVTAGNASGINDGAALLYLMEEEQAQQWGIKPLASIVTSVTLAIDETVMGYTPKLVIDELLRKSGLAWEDLSSVEVNEAFAVQTLAVLKDLGVSPDDYNRVDLERPVKVNPWGGAIALGHPIGCSGARIITTLAHTLRWMKEVSSTNQPIYGIAALCVGGGQGCGVLLEA